MCLGHNDKLTMPSYYCMQIEMEEAQMLQSRAPVHSIKLLSCYLPQLQQVHSPNPIMLHNKCSVAIKGWLYEVLCYCHTVMHHASGCIRPALLCSVSITLGFSESMLKSMTPSKSPSSCLQPICINLLCFHIHLFGLGAHSGLWRHWQGVKDL